MTTRGLGFREATLRSNHWALLLPTMVLPGLKRSADDAMTQAVWIAIEVNINLVPDVPTCDIDLAIAAPLDPGIINTPR